MTQPPATTTHVTYVVEHYRPGVGTEGLQNLAERVRNTVAEMAREGTAIRCVSSTVMPDDEYFQSVIEAASPRLVRRAHARAGVSFDRMSVAIPIDGTGGT